jgi:hypothetical protein
MNEIKTGAARDPQPGLLVRLAERLVDRLLSGRKGGR